MFSLTISLWTESSRELTVYLKVLHKGPLELTRKLGPLIRGDLSRYSKILEY